jgi:hypothetical protein
MCVLTQTPTTARMPVAKDVRTIIAEMIRLAQSHASPRFLVASGTPVFIR